MPLDMPIDFTGFSPGRASYRPYYRVSHEKSLKGSGWERQMGRDDTSDEAVAAKLGLPLGPPLDSGRKAVSGFRGKNVKEGVLAAYIKLVLDQKVPRGDVIGIDEWSRLTRMPLRRATRLLMDLTDAGIGIYVKRLGTLITADTIDDEGMGAMSLTMALLHLKMAHQASADKARYTRDAVDKAHEDARDNGAVRTRATPAWLSVSTTLSYKEAKAQGVKREYIQEPNPCHVLRTIFPMALDLGQKTIADWLNAQWWAGDERYAPFGLSRGSGGWYPASVGALLANPAVYGLVVRTRVNEITGETTVRAGDEYLGYPEIITKDLFDKVQAAIADRRRVDTDSLGRKAGKGGRKGYAVPNLFSGRCVCVACGGPVTLYTARPGVSKRPRIKLIYTYLRCRGAKIGAGCKAPAMAYEPFERGVLTALVEMPLVALRPPEAGTSPALKEQQTLAKELSVLAGKAEAYDNETDEDRKAFLEGSVVKWGARMRVIKARLLELQPIVDREAGEDNPGERLMTIKWLRATALTTDGPERIEARRAIHTALLAVIDRVVVAQDRTATVVLKGLHGVMKVANGEAMTFGMEADRRLATRDYLAEHQPERLDDHDEIAAKLPK